MSDRLKLLRDLEFGIRKSGHRISIRKSLSSSGKWPCMPKRPGFRTEGPPNRVDWSRPKTQAKVLNAVDRDQLRLPGDETHREDAWILEQPHQWLKEQLSSWGDPGRGCTVIH